MKQKYFSQPTENGTFKIMRYNDFTGKIESMREYYPTQEIAEDVARQLNEDYFEDCKPLNKNIDNKNS